MESPRLRPRRLGLIVNPIAGLGGTVALKGTDGAVDQALRLGAHPKAASRAAHALRALCAQTQENVELFTAASSMGEDTARASGFNPIVVGIPANTATTAADTQQAAQAMAAAGVDLLLFAGGDGTARDIFQVVRERLPILGIPAGVKMHSAVFATSPMHAGEVARRYLDDEHAVSVGSAEVMDREVSSAGRTSPRLYGFARTPHLPLFTQYAKSSVRVDDEAVLQAACRRAAQLAHDDAITIIGPGTTARSVKQALGFAGTLDGVDLVRHGHVFALDVTESQILDVLGEHHASTRARIIVSIVGGQGYLFGRGNQQISARVIERAGRDNIVVVSARSKLLALPEHCLFVDTGDPAIDEMLSGYIHIWTGSRERVVYRIEGGNACAPVS